MNQNNISTAELFQRVRELLMLPELEPQTRNKMMHDTLILCCHEGVKDTRPKEKSKNITPMSAQVLMSVLSITDMVYGMCGLTMKPAMM